MWTIEPADFLMLYLSIMGIGSLIFWIAFHLTRRKKQLVLYTFKPHTCTICLTPYFPKEQKGPTKCPSCGSYNNDIDLI